MKQIIFILLLLTSKIFAQQSGDLDITFGLGGKITTQFPNQNFNTGISGAVQNDGKIVVVGGSLLTDTTATFAVARYNSDGTLDTSFDTDGMLFTSFGTTVDIAVDVAIQTDGKIVVLGWSFDIVNGYSKIVLSRYEVGGMLDNTFNGTGKLAFNIINSVADKMNSLAIQTDGKIILGGQNGGNVGLVRLNSDGTLDNNFGVSGVVNTIVGSVNSEVVALDLATNGKIVVACGDGSGYFGAIRYNIDGTLDNSFGNAGISITPLGNSIAEVTSMGIQTDGKIVVAGEVDFQFSLLRYNTDGTLDNSFGIGGKVINDMTFGANNPSEINGIAIQADGKILAIGDTFDVAMSPSNYILACYNSDGTFDSTFNSDGMLFDVFYSSGKSNASDIVLQVDGKILVIGFAEFSGVQQFGVARYLSSLSLGILDFSFLDNHTFVYPNPIAESTTLSYTLASAAIISITLFDNRGIKLHSFVENTYQMAGKQEQFISLSNLPNGIYYLELSGERGKIQIKLIK